MSLNIKQQLTKNSLHQEILSAITKLSNESKTPAYVVGGYVRDLILKRNTKD